LKIVEIGSEPSKIKNFYQLVSILSTGYLGVLLEIKNKNRQCRNLVDTIGFCYSDCQKSVPFQKRESGVPEV
jgi:hypothetical protein